MRAAFLNSLICPDCGSGLRIYAAGKKGDVVDEGVLYCISCKRAYPITEGVPILLDDERKRKWDAQLLSAMLPSIKNRLVSGLVEGMIARIKSLDTSSGWEWDDVKHWQGVYEKQLSESGRLDQKNLRYFQRRQLLGRLARLKENAIVLEIGCGSGITTSRLFNFRESHALYIGTDMSMNAIRLNKRTMNYENSEYILCAGDNLPIKNNHLDYLIIFGVMHHMPQKARVLDIVKAKVKQGGIIITHEGIIKPRPIPRFMEGRIFGKIKDSAHEERIKLSDLEAAVKRTGRVIARMETMSPLMELVYAAFPQLAKGERNYSTYKIIAAIDRLSSRTLGRIFRSMRGEEWLYVVRNEE
ncbi:hypothetical protein COT48_00925 [Candidatus Woesearchaeota archaeon CG08_land_8_20_14_0_20_47_9]|nr:MAG: hypothetical protein COT48_00925 [Candidatus Woesearchaeota archaeon CG08_land_8_20_14_0_20_47_9]HII30020.1 methyltransferase domain-containing protein [Candidatus Woesearchaeota archaeon]